jgi:hypothetical protein
VRDGVSGGAESVCARVPVTVDASERLTDAEEGLDHYTKTMAAGCVVRIGSSNGTDGPTSLQN